ARRAEVNVSRLVNIAQGVYKGHTWEWERLTKYYERLQYTRMRIAGVPVEDARRYKSASPSSVDTIISVAKTLQERIAYYYGLDVKDIRRGFQMSSKSIADIYSGYIKYPVEERWLG
ncbi:MAG: hypothetical protein QXN35_06960, partial [Ignisphaera sp.]